MPPFCSDLSLGRAWGSVTLGNNIERSVFHFAGELELLGRERELSEGRDKAWKAADASVLASGWGA